MPEFIGSSMNLKIRLVDIFPREELGTVFWMVLKLLHPYLGASSKKQNKTWQMSLVAEEQRTCNLCEQHEYMDAPSTVLILAHRELVCQL